MRKSFTGVLLLASVIVVAQTDITTIATSYTTATGTTYTGPYAAGGNSAYSTGNFQYNFGANANATNHKSTLLNFTAGGNTYVSLPVNPLVFLRRGAAVANTVIYYKGAEAPGTGGITTHFNLESPYVNSMETMLSGYNNFNTGVDNLFVNTGDANGNNNNIEKVEVIFPAARTVVDATREGIAIFERGETNQHDGFTIAIIETVDAGNIVTNFYNNVKKMNATTYGNTNLISNPTDQNYYVLRKPLAGALDMRIAVQATTNMGGVFFKFSDFGITNGQSVKGYAILDGGYNITNGNQIIEIDPNGLFGYNNFTGETFGGLDLVAMTGLFELSSTLPLAPTLSATIQNNQIKLNWNGQGNDVEKIEVEKSVNGNNFIPIYTQFTNANSFTDNAFYYQMQWYRIKFTATNGQVTYSNIIRVKKSSTNRFVEILSAIPLSNNYVDIKINVLQKETIEINVLDTDGKILQHKTYILESGSSMLHIALPNKNNKAVVLKVISATNSFSQVII